MSLESSFADPHVSAVVVISPTESSLNPLFCLYGVIIILSITCFLIIRVYTKTIMSKCNKSEKYF